MATETFLRVVFAVVDFRRPYLSAFVDVRTGEALRVKSATIYLRCDEPAAALLEVVTDHDTTEMIGVRILGNYESNKQLPMAQPFQAAAGEP